MKIKVSAYFSLFIIYISATLIIGTLGCANIVPPGGGPKDSLPPVLIAATPKDSAINFTGERIILNFDEFVEVQNAFENVIVSPTPTNVPNISYKFRNVTIRLKDTLEPNTTYSINFGNALKDINEGNVYKDFTYVFSTGRTVDQNSLSGRVIMAETGKIDTTLLVVLHRNLDDSAVAKEKPRYIAKPQSTNPKDRKKQEKQLRIQNNLESGRQDILSNLELTFSQPIKNFDSTKIILANKDFTPVAGYTIAADTNKTKFTIVYNWVPNTNFNLLISKDAFIDSAGLTLAKNDTITFSTKSNEDYGSVRLRFKNLDLSKTPILQIVQNDKIMESSPLTGFEWVRKLYNPGDYDLRILYDDNKNGKWDPGRFFGVHKQPEIVVPINSKLSVRGNWDNEKEITL